MMDRFRSRKKDRPEGLAGRLLINDASGPFKTFGRKKVVEDGKQNVNLETALPPSDDFRTSLLMTGLSARFSMLRERDNPSSKLGKASDDSVLFSKRQSRMDLAVVGESHGIAEVDSIRAPFRADSFVSPDDNISYTGSIMNRVKPTEGNNLFGGRQKIYRIPAGGSSKNHFLSGRALYEDDVALSALQRWRQAEKKLGEDFASDSLDIDHVDYNKRSDISSKISFAPSRTRDSTAATSVASSLTDGQSNAATSDSGTATSGGLKRSVTRTRRLYEDGLTQDLQDQRSSASSRFDNLSRPRPAERRPLGGKASLSPPISETGDHMGLSIQPNDRGKAAAMGVFARRSEQYDESRYAQRQRQLQQGRETPTNREFADFGTSSPATRSSSIQRGPSDSNALELPSGLKDRSRIAFSKSRPILPATLERPNDHDHPAFRHSALPAPLHMSSWGTSNAKSPIVKKLNPLDARLAYASSDSPMLEPSAGLSGMVRQHLRNTSSASSVYGNRGHNSGGEVNAQPALNRASPPRMSIGKDDWRLSEHECNQSFGADASPLHASDHAGAPRPKQDEFTRHLTEGARRVREKLMSYAEPDGPRTGPPSLAYSEATQDTGPKQNGDILRSKTIRNSVADRTEEPSESLHRLASLRIRSSSRYFSLIMSPGAFR